jgi:hypothetical protein
MDLLEALKKSEFTDYMLEQIAFLRKNYYAQHRFL